MREGERGGGREGEREGGGGREGEREGEREGGREGGKQEKTLQNVPLDAKCCLPGIIFKKLTQLTAESTPRPLE